MDANKGEAERCLRAAEKWQRQNRPVKALRFAQKSHRLFPTPEAQRKIGELTDLTQQRRSDRLLNNSSSSSQSSPQNNTSSSSQHNARHSQPQPENQEFVEIDPNLSNNTTSALTSLLYKIISIESWYPCTHKSIPNTLNFTQIGHHHWSTYSAVSSLGFIVLAHRYCHKIYFILTCDIGKKYGCYC